MKKIKLAYSVAEPLSGVDEDLCPIIFLHCFLGSKELWHDIPQIVSDKTKRRAYAYDARNHGDSEWTDEHSLELNVNDLCHFMNSNNIPKAILIGHSIGGRTVVQFALMFPERVELLISIDIYVGKFPQSAVDFVESHTRLWPECIRSAPSYLSKTEAIKFAVDSFYDQIPCDKKKGLSDPECLYKCDFSLRRNGDQSYELKANVPALLKFLSSLWQCNKDAKGIYDGPAYFFYGELSPLQAHLYEVDVKKSFPNAKILIIEDATHNIPLEIPEEFTEEVLNCILRDQVSS